jgi:hypothetical protein
VKITIDIEGALADALDGVAETIDGARITVQLRLPGVRVEVVAKADEVATSWNAETETVELRAVALEATATRDGQVLLTLPAAPPAPVTAEEVIDALGALTESLKKLRVVANGIWGRGGHPAETIRLWRVALGDLRREVTGSPERRLLPDRR